MLGCQSEGFLLGFGLIQKSKNLSKIFSDSPILRIRNPNLVNEKCTLKYVLCTRKLY